MCGPAPQSGIWVMVHCRMACLSRGIGYITHRHAYLRSFAGVSSRRRHDLRDLPRRRASGVPADTTASTSPNISPSLAKRTVAMALDGKLADLTDPIEHDAKIEFIGREDPRALELIRHDAAPVLAEAVQIALARHASHRRPVIDNGFYYDFFRNEPFTPEDFDAIEKKMREIIARDKPFTKEVWSRDEAKKVFRDKGEAFKVELIDAIPEDQQIKIYKQGDWFDLAAGRT